jgi:eukaryotic-like serine/threonine-protein kinase
MPPDEPPFRFTPLAKIASGGSATVYVGRGPSGLVAIKRPHPHVLEDERQRSALLREARIAASLHHPNIVEVHEVETLGTEMQLVMQYVEGTALGTLIAVEAKADHRLPPAVAVRIVLDASAGLEAVHEKRDASGNVLGLVHRDISPQNILVGVDGVARLTDFGLAKAVYEGAPSTTQGTLKGKLGYMAPEYIGHGQLAGAVDVFAMGVVLWEALAGRRLFRGDNEIQTLDRVLRDEPPPLADVSRELAPFDPVVARAVAKDPAARFPSARAFAEALSDAAQAAGTQVGHDEVGTYVALAVGSDLARRRESVKRAERRAGARQRQLVAVLAFATVLAAGGLALTLGRGERAPPAPLTPIVTSPATTSSPLPAPEPPPPAASFELPATSSPTPTSSPRPRPASPAPRSPPPNPYVHHGGTR